MKVAVLLSTYNGRQYIITQLESLRDQTYSDFDVIISDDCSTDDTYEIVCNFIVTHSLRRWHIEKNSENIGWKKNFLRMMKSVDSDYVFLCDQDDYWHPRKIEIMVNVMNENGKIGLLASKYHVFYDDNDWDNKWRADLTESITVKRGIKKNCFMKIGYPGCTYCVRKSLIKQALPFWEEHMTHDGTLWRIAFLEDSLYIIDAKLIAWRQHNDSAMGGRNRHLNDKERVKDISVFKDYIHFLNRSSSLENIITKEKKQLLIKYNKWIDLRYEFVVKKKLFLMLFLLKYIYLYPTVANFAGDCKDTIQRSK